MHKMVVPALSILCPFCNHPMTGSIINEPTISLINLKKVGCADMHKPPRPIKFNRQTQLMGRTSTSCMKWVDCRIKIRVEILSPRRRDSLKIWYSTIGPTHDDSNRYQNLIHFLGHINIILLQ